MPVTTTFLIVNYDSISGLQCWYTLKTDVFSEDSVLTRQVISEHIRGHSRFLSLLLVRSPSEKNDSDKPE